MRTPLLVLGFFACASMAGCGAVKTAPDADLRAAALDGSYTLSVRSDNAGLDALLYPMAVEELAPLLPIGTTAPVNGEVQVLFSTTQTLSDPSVGFGVGSAVGTWGSGASSSGSAVSGGPRAYLDGSLLVVVRDSAGRQLWFADCRHKGRFSLAATPQEVARLCLQQVAHKLSADLKKAGISPAKRSEP
jgi:hypothetical protein